VENVIEGRAIEVRAVEVRYAGVVVGRSTKVRDWGDTGAFIGFTEPLPSGTSLVLKGDGVEQPARVIEVIESADPTVAGMQVRFVGAAEAVRPATKPAPAPVAEAAPAPVAEAAPAEASEETSSLASNESPGPASSEQAEGDTGQNGQLGSGGKRRRRRR
jgi:hypothetical protein